MQFFTYDNWKIHKKNCDSKLEQLFSSIEKTFLCKGVLIVKDRISEVVKFSSVGQSKSYYIKRYTESGRKSFSFFRKSRIASESSNLFSLDKMGIPVPAIISHGEKRSNGRFIAGALITEEIENTSNLAQHLNEDHKLTDNKKWLYSVIDQLAQHIATMHRNKFIHRDLNLRNILITTNNKPAIYLIDCPAGGFKWGSFLKKGIIRDLAHLDKVARYCLSTKDLLRFYKKYKNIDQLTKKDKRLIYKIRHFHDKHRARQNRKPGKAYRTI